MFALGIILSDLLCNSPTNRGESCPLDELGQTHQEKRTQGKYNSLQDKTLLGTFDDLRKMTETLTTEFHNQTLSDTIRHYRDVVNTDQED